MLAKNKTILGNYQYLGNNLIHKVSNVKFHLVSKAIKSDNRLRLINYLVDASSNEFFCQLDMISINRYTETYSFNLNGLEFNLKLNKGKSLINIKYVKTR
jgi:hypothetical protein